MSGQLAYPALQELVQMFASGGHSVRIDLIAVDGSRGSVTIESGVVGLCRFGKLLGEEAFYALCRISGRFMVYRIDPERHRRATVKRGWQELLLEAARQEDEATRDSELAQLEQASLPSLDSENGLFPSESEESSSVDGNFEEILQRLQGPPAEKGNRQSALPDIGPLDVPKAEAPKISVPSVPSAPSISEHTAEPEAVPATPDDGFSDLFAEATKAYLVRDLDEAERLFAQCAEIRPDDRRVQTNLRRLAEKKKERG